MVSRENLRQHLARRNAVCKIESSLSKLSSIHYEPEELKSNSIQVLPMSLTSERSPVLEPCFYKPFEEDLLDPDLEFMGEEFPWFGRHGGFTDAYTPIDSTRVINSYFGSYTSFLACRNPEKPARGQYERKYANLPNSRLAIVLSDFVAVAGSWDFHNSMK